MGDSNLELGVNFQGPGYPRLYNREPFNQCPLALSVDLRTSQSAVALFHLGCQRASASGDSVVAL
jgi:hypothetical protein